jgi:hypothetical protein
LSQKVDECKPLALGADVTISEMAMASNLLKVFRCRFTLSNPR